MDIRLDLERKVLSVGEVTRQIRFSLEDRFSSVWVEGEISDFFQHRSGHMYFSLKDSDAILKCVMFRQDNSRIRFRPESGLKVICQGRISVYAPRGQYQMNVTTLEPKGLGDLQLAFEQVKKRLETEGLFDSERKRPIPYMPRAIGVITSLTGAVIRDMLHVFDRRHPGYHIYLRPTQVQGKTAKDDIVAAIEECNVFGKLDVIVLARGGGSLEDLWAFNEEVVARAIAASRIPVLSAIGHEVDYTISDFVADGRAPTPSAAAEILLPDKSALQASLKDVRGRLDREITGFISRKCEELAVLMQNRSLTDAKRFFEMKIQRLDELSKDIQRALELFLERCRDRWTGWVGRLEALSPLACLIRGYSITTDSRTSQVVKHTKDLQAGQRVKTRLAAGSFISKIEDIHHDPDKRN
jgi:exodeoxyribonuclease VII large subunit